MSRNYYIFQSGQLRRKDNTIYFENENTKRPIPIEDVESFYAFGELSLNTKLLDFLAQKNVPIHFFNYYDYYSGSYYPREELNSGYLVVNQVNHYDDSNKRMAIAREIVSAASDNILRNLKYYRNRVGGLKPFIENIEKEQEKFPSAGNPFQLMGVEGRIRDIYYESFNEILNLDEPFEKRVKRPPDNVINTLISFGNSMLYSTCLSEIYRTQLNPLISFLHEPGERRYSLSLDMSEIFKPIIVDRIIFKLLNSNMLGDSDFEKNLNYCYLQESGRKTFTREYDKKLNQTIKHRDLERKVSYQRLIRLENYKLIKHLTGEEDYEGFRIWW